MGSFRILIFIILIFSSCRITEKNEALNCNVACKPWQRCVTGECKDSWIPLNFPELEDGLFVTSGLMNPENPKIMHISVADYFYGVDGIFRTEDGGRHWDMVTEGLANKNTVTLSFNPNNPQEIFAGTGYINIEWFGTYDGPLLFKSSDGGKTWNGVETLDLSVERADSNVFAWGTIIWDANFSPHSGEIYVLSGSYQVRGDITSTSDLTVEERGRIMKSPDNGQTWVDVSRNLPEDAIFYKIAFHPFDKNTIFVATSRGLYKTTDGGTSWSNKTEKILPSISIFTVAVDPVNPLNVYIGLFGVTGTLELEGGGVYKSSDGGENFVECNNGIPRDNYIRSILIDPENPDTVYAGAGYIPSNAPSAEQPPPPEVSPPGINQPKDDFAVFKTTDGGATWLLMDEGFPHYGQDRFLPFSLGVSFLNFSPSNKEVIYAGVYGGGIYVWGYGKEGF